LIVISDAVGDSVTVLSVDASTGALLLIPGSPFTASRP
jgi:hypothetical protein